jgi:hypothetical protein
VNHHAWPYLIALLRIEKDLCLSIFFLYNAIYMPKKIRTMISREELE